MSVFGLFQNFFGLFLLIYNCLLKGDRKIEGDDMISVGRDGDTQWLQINAINSANFMQTITFDLDGEQSEAKLEQATSKDANNNPAPKTAAAQVVGAFGAAKPVEEEIDIDLNDPEVGKAATKIQVQYY